jgi:DNA-binding Lrp family transcriptional regulator
VTLRARARSLKAFERAVRYPDVMECYLMSGDADYLIRVVAADTQDYERIRKQHLTRLPGVAHPLQLRPARVCKKTALDV